MEQLIPARHTVAARSRFWEQLEPDLRAGLEAALQRRAQISPGQRLSTADWYFPLRRAIDQVLSGQQSPRQALAEAQATRERLQQQAPPTAPPGQLPLMVATPVPEPTSVAGAARLTFATTPSSAQHARQLATHLNAARSDFSVGVRVDDTAMRLAHVASGADCFTWPTPPAAFDHELLLDLQPFLDAEPAAGVRLQDDFPPALLARFEQNGKLYGLPYIVTAPTLGYNPALFAAAGLSAPADAWTPDDLRNAAQLLNSGAGSQRRYGYAVPGEMTQDLRFFLGRFGAAPVTVQDDALVIQFTSQRVLEALRFYLTLLRDYSPHTRLDGYKPGAGDLDVNALIAQGRVGLWLNTSLSAPALEAGVAPAPWGQRPPAPDDLGISGLYIGAHTPNIAACWDWISALSGDMASLKIEAQQPARFPARRSAIPSASAFDGAAVVAATQAALARPVLDEPPAVWTAPVDYFWFYRAVDRALQGNDLERELQDAQFLTEQYLACIGGGERPGVCARQVDPDYQGFAAP